MCRLMAFSSLKETTIPSFMGETFSGFVELSNIHHDSWGLALTEAGNARLVKKAETAAKSSDFRSTIDRETSTGGLLHFRWASPGIPVKDVNAHPFTYGDIAFIHNGALSPYDALQSLVSPELASSRQGDTDSELFFLYLLTEINKHGFVDGVVGAMRNIKAHFKYSSINSMIMNSEFLVITSEHDPVNKPDWADDIYYELRYRIDSTGVAVASSGWNQDGWTLMKNHEILIVERSSLKTTTVTL